MGLVSFGAGILRAGARFLGIGGAPAATGFRAAAGTAGRFAARAAPGAATGAAGAAAFEAFRGFGVDGVNGAVDGAPVGPTGPIFVTLDDGSQVLVNKSGAVPRPQLFLPAGAKLPPGSTIVSVSPDGNLFGIRRMRKRRTFAGEIERCKNAVKAADSLITAVRKKK